ncbi:MAG: IS3 family transposase [Ilumatobacteraceae bacterium]
MGVHPSRSRRRAGAIDGSIGDCYDNGQMEPFSERMQVELLNRKRWNTRLEWANPIFEYLEIFHNRQRRHSSLGMLSPIEFELRHANNPPTIKPADRAKPSAHKSSHQTQADSALQREHL